jgi:hypothetical protein
MTSEVETTSAEAEAERPVSIFDICETDAKAEEDGKWFKDVFGDGTNIDVKLRSIMSQASLACRRRLDKTFRRHMKNGDYPPEIMKQIMTEQIVEGVLLDWKGIYDRDGNEIVYSKPAAKKLLTALHHFRDRLAVLSNSLEGFKVEEREDGAKN